MPNPCDAYIVCTSPRSGSTLLCKLLGATGVAGRPGSLFHRPEIAAWRDAHGIVARPEASERDVLRAIFQAAIREGRGDTGVFGLRLQGHSFPFFARQLAILHPDRPSDLARLQAAFGRTRFIHLARRDKVGQAVSLVRAHQTGLWHRAPDGTELERLVPPRPARYDRDAIAAEHEALLLQERAWHGWFASEGIEPLRVTYEALAADPLATLGRLLDALGLDRAASAGVTPGVAKLADETSAEWVERFMADLASGRAQ